MNTLSVSEENQIIKLIIQVKGFSLFLSLFVSQNLWNY